MLKRGFLYFGLALFASSAFISCEKCKDCSYSQSTYYQNIPSLSGISNQAFSKIEYFKQVVTPHELGETCGDNLSKYDDKVFIDTLYVENYIDNAGVTQPVVGGITRLHTRTFTCK